ncbi:helix-turn-helix transcriptional regulator [Leptospira santarosai]|uniref:helix-turn-helix transcriptional regulator n=1 Tax=Leptospira santarosai TaxID=28183 RepID=UPI000773EBBA|nr:helix-turn-helix transcriptional regulator [Leptospira santarosai]
MEENVMQEQLGIRLKDAREYCGYSQDEVAKYLGVPRSAISLMESNSRKVSAIELSKLATLYQTSIEELTGSKVESSQSDSIKMVARATAQLSEKDREEVLRFAQFLKSKGSNPEK